MKQTPDGEIKFKNIDEYHANFSPAIQLLLNQLRKAIIETAPNAIEVISYNMPAFKLNKVLAYYAVHKNHIGFYPTPSPIIHFEQELLKYKTSKGAIQFPLDKALPIGLIKKLIKYRISSICK